MSHNDLSRRRAKHALDAIKSLEGRPGADKYASYAKNLPAVIRANGLGQALAMLRSRAKADSDSGQGGASPAAYQALYDHLEGWFRSSQCPRELSLPDDARLLETAIEASQSKYLLYQTEASLYVEWLKKFANAFLKEEPGLAVGGNNAQDDGARTQEV